MNTNLIVIFDDLKYKSKVQSDGLLNLTVWTVIPFLNALQFAYETLQCAYC